MLWQLIDDATILPDRKEYNPAERVVFNQIYLSETSGICLMGLEITLTPKLGSR